MAIPPSNIRGVQDIRTLSGRADPVSEPYQIYMRLTCLEMEKARRAKEREGAAHRVNSIDARFNDIEAEKAVLLKTLAEKNRGDLSGVSGTGSQKDAHPSATGFKIKY